MSTLEKDKLKDIEKLLENANKLNYYPLTQLFLKNKMLRKWFSKKDLQTKMGKRRDGTVRRFLSRSRPFLPPKLKCFNAMQVHKTYDISITKYNHSDVFDVSMKNLIVWGFNNW